jgi:hypothetical protein
VIERGGIVAVGASAAGPLLDAKAKAAYRERMADLNAEIGDAEPHNDPARAELARVELDALTGQLAAAAARTSGTWWRRAT